MRDSSMTKERRPYRPRLSTTTARLEFAEHNLDMIGEWVGAVLRPQPCRCTICGKDVAPRLHSLRNGQGACKHCAGKAPLTDVELTKAFLSVNMQPLGPILGGTHTPQPCRCLVCGLEGAPTADNIKRGRSGGCKHCGVSHIQRTKMAKRQDRWQALKVLYLCRVELANERFVYKVGYGSERRSRIFGGDVVRSIEFPAAYAFFAEQQILDAIRKPTPEHLWVSSCHGRTETISSKAEALRLMHHYEELWANHQDLMKESVEHWLNE